MTMVTPTEAFDRITHFFHVVLKKPPAGHGPNRDDCWACQAAAYAVVTSPSKQAALPSFKEKLGVSW